MELTERLREAIDETERIAQAAIGDSVFDGTGIVTGPRGSAVMLSTAARHIARHDPAAVLCRCAVDRKILDPHTPMQWAFKWIGPMENPANRVPDMRCSACWTDYDPDGKFDHECHHAPHEWPCETVRALAEAYGVEA